MNSYERRVRNQVVNKVRIVLWLALISCSALAQAALVVSITGTVRVALSCTINNGNPVNIDFGDDLVTAQVDGVNYAKEINFAMNCTVPPSTLDVWFEGAGSSFDPKLLVTDLPSLAIRFIKEDSSQLDLGDKVRFTDPAAPPIIKAAPMKARGSNPTGRFNASAVLKVDVA